ncbi:MAG: transposase [Akkermansiaceae bacterium]
MPYVWGACCFCFIAVVFGGPPTLINTKFPKTTRRHLSAEFKARIAREAMENQKTIQQIAKDNDNAPTPVSAWKKELESRSSEIFERKNATNEAAVNFEKKSARLERRIGQLLIEKEFLEGKCNEGFEFGT